LKFRYFIPFSMALFMCILHPAMSFFSIVSLAMVISFMPVVFFSPAAILSMSPLAFIIFASLQSISAATAGLQFNPVLAHRQIADIPRH
jgi:hypothetical protein